MAATWVPGAEGSGYGVEHLPYGSVRPLGGEARPVVRVGDSALDLRALARAGELPEAGDAFEAPDLNAFLRRGRPAWAATRRRLAGLLSRHPAPPVARAALLGLDEAEVLLPVTVGDFVDFSSSLEHATKVGQILRPDGKPLAPNWRRQPIGYHGRSGTVAVSGTPVRRPWGQRPPASPGEPPSYGPERALDFELELGFVTGDGPAGGAPIAADDAAQRIFGFLLVNDWSARELQRWESRPLGPFLGKSFLTSVGGWLTPLEALRGRRVAGPAQQPPPPAHLRTRDPWALDVELEAAVSPTATGPETVVSRVNARRLYWSAAQQLAHATSNGATVRAGDLFASGTVSGWEPGTAGCLLEATEDGRRPLELRGGMRRTFLDDGDTVVLRGRAGPLTLGEVRGTVVEAARDPRALR